MTERSISGLLSTEVEHAIAAVLGGEQAMAQCWVGWVNYIDSEGERRWAFLEPEGQFPDTSMMCADLASMHATMWVEEMLSGRRDD